MITTLHRLAAYEKLSDVARAYRVSTAAIVALNPHKEAVNAPGIGAVFVELEEGETIRVPGVGRGGALLINPPKYGGVFPPPKDPTDKEIYDYFNSGPKFLVTFSGLSGSWYLYKGADGTLKMGSATKQNSAEIPVYSVGTYSILAFYTGPTSVPLQDGHIYLLNGGPLPGGLTDAGVVTSYLLKAVRTPVPAIQSAGLRVAVGGEPFCPPGLTWSKQEQACVPVPYQGGGNKCLPPLVWDSITSSCILHQTHGFPGAQTPSG